MKKLYEETSIQNIADAIRSKNGSTDTYTVAEMAAAIQALSTGGLSTDLYPKVPESWLTKDYTFTRGGRTWNIFGFGFYYGPRNNMYSSYLSISPDPYPSNESTILVDWGDGTSEYVKYSGSHEYSSPGFYCITSPGARFEWNIYTPFASLNINQEDETSSTPGRVQGLISVFSSGFISSSSAKIYRSKNVRYMILGPGSQIKSLTNKNILGEVVAIYVDDSQLSQYRSATNWSSRSDIIHPLSECPFIE